MRTTLKRSWGRFCRRGIGRFLRWKRRGRCFLTPALFATRRSRRSLTGWRIIRSIGRRGNSLASWGAWRSRRGRRFLSALLMFRWFVGRLLTGIFRRCWCSWRLEVSGLPASTIAPPTSALRPSTRLAPIRIAGTSLLLRDATSSAPTAWCLTRGARSGAGLPPLLLKRRGNWWTWAIRRFNCLGKTLTLTAIPMERKALPSCWRRSLRWRGFGGVGLLLLILGILGGILLTSSARCRRFAITCTCPCRADLRACSMPCSGSTLGTSTWSGLGGFRRRGAISLLPAI